MLQFQMIYNSFFVHLPSLFFSLNLHCKHFQYFLKFYFELHPFFNNLPLSNKTEKNFCSQFVFLFHAITLINFFQMSWNWYMLFICDIAWIVLKMVYIQLMVCLQRHTKVFRYITVYGGKILKAYFNMFILQ